MSDESPMVGPYHCDCCGRVRPADDAYPQPDRRVLCGNCDSGDQPGCANCNGMTDTPESTAQRARIDQGEGMDTIDPDTCEQIVHAALAAGDAEGVHCALVVMAAQDPHRAQLLLDTIQLGLALADPR